MAGLLENLCQSQSGAAPGSNKTSNIDLLTLFKSASGVSDGISGVLQLENSLIPCSV